MIANLSQSVTHLLNGGATRLVIVCNTCHAFVPQVAQREPRIKSTLIHLIQTTAEDLCQRHITDVGLIASEGTIQTHIYNDFLKPYGIRVHSPNETQFANIRYFIEQVKQNKYDAHVLKEFEDFVSTFPTRAIILGCTELPILAKHIVPPVSKILIDPLECVIQRLVNYQF